MKLFDNRPLTAFAILCFIWGTTWLATKVALETMPPLFMAGTRFVVAGLIMTAVSWPRNGDLPFRRADAGRLLVATLFMIVLCYGPLFWAMQFIESGLAAVIDMSLTPVALLVCAVAMRQEEATPRKIFALILGVAGVVIMFLPDLSRLTAAGSGGMRIIGGLVTASAAFTYAFGSVIAKPLLKIYSTTLLSGLTTLIGGAILLGVSLGFEPGAVAALDLTWGFRAWMGWLYLMLFGSLIAFALYMQLLRDLGASKSGNFAFVSPAIAVIAGAVVLGERIEWLSWIGMAVMLTAAFISLHGAEKPR
ncbi:MULTISPECIES: DMT family transporter [Asticcacaulis]|uniref:DMT family transporter n=1 Tax=Asticcacaulis TaxID=76890 RepID=UPI001AEA50FC|nr:MULTISPECIES: EamA family transporter [Asticcacaulis]MBP2158725.1 drug/metabolite transporter (DMT)-like permease [Asticcacaulis solisilvae]MDR6799771.1 drug/metabolite transporter (DMT)-like permease [Asticcacaulis sp. BE141]